MPGSGPPPWRPCSCARTPRGGDTRPRHLRRALRSQGALLAAGVVVEAKRSRAGRSVFLPGGWVEAKAPNKPFEAAEAELYGLALDAVGRPSGPCVRFLALRPLPQIFAEAWRQWP